MSRPLDIRAFLATKRDGKAHPPADIRAMVEAYTRGKLPDYQVSAWLMAAYLNGLDDAETDALTEALLHSGRVFDWSDLGRPSADKHSTGGVGDKISLILAPIVAACDVLVPMVSGRGLGHTGGTLDKLESIPGFSTQLDPDAMKKQLDAIGVVMVGQGPDLAPADGKLYALRDVTSTVAHQSFIVPSIVSKKAAEGAGALAYDVKCGNGAFMQTHEDASSLARRLVKTTRALGRKAVALVTDMNQPLGRTAGNVLEVRESVDVLHGRGPADVRELTLELSAIMLHLAGAEPSHEAARARAEKVLDSGAAWRKFVQMIEAQRGDPASVEKEDGLPWAPVVADVKASSDGHLSKVDTYGLGMIVVRIGGGRAAKEDEIDPRVGLVTHARIGDPVKRGDVLAQLHLASEDADAVRDAAACFEIGAKVDPPALVMERVD